jgi:hypothetical protein
MIEMTMTGWPSYPSVTPNGTADWSARPENHGNVAAPPTPPANPNARIRLTNLSDVAKELKKLYREARGGKLATAEATKLAYLLNMLAGILTASDLEERLAALEADKAG